MSDAQLKVEAPVVFGEVLFDHFVDGTRVLGGAPFNVAWHLSGFGLEPRFVSAVGADEAGEEVRRRMQTWGMNTDGVQVDALHPTGRVTARIVDGDPVFDIADEQAYDYVQRESAKEAVREVDVGLVYHGTLALRRVASFEALTAVRRATGAPSFVDLNLRRPWWSSERVEACLESARWLKLNRDELETLTGKAVDAPDACQDPALELAEVHDLDAVVVTLGGRGSVMASRGRVWIGEPRSVPSKELVDTVGAGDAFSAVACVGLLEAWEPRAILERGNAFAAEICRFRGATVEDRSIYQRHLAAWGER